jgi:hypothetical protein
LRGDGATAEEEACYTEASHFQKAPALDALDVFHVDLQLIWGANI